jgi:hypothetical protein
MIGLEMFSGTHAPFSLSLSLTVLPPVFPPLLAILLPPFSLLPSSPSSGVVEGYEHLDNLSAKQRVEGMSVEVGPFRLKWAKNAAAASRPGLPKHRHYNRAANVLRLTKPGLTNLLLDVLCSNPVHRLTAQKLREELDRAMAKPVVGAQGNKAAPSRRWH